MPAAAQILPIVKDDPLAHLHDGAIARASGHPIPLRATRIVVRIDGGLAIVRTERVFANTEAEPIEATYTFSVPVHATLARMTVRIGDRHLVAQARLRDAARTDYEDAIDAGKTAVLHEEVLRGIHMLSVGAIPPGGELAVTSTWAIPLQAVSADLALLRVPTTIGQVYGRPPMSDSDAPFHGDARLEADLEVTCDSGSVRLANAGLIDGRAQLPLNAPIDIEVVGWIPRPLRGRAADGRVVTLDIEPAETGEAALDFALLIDRSGSMGSGATIANQSPLSTHDVVVSGLCAADALLHPGDYVEAWQFDTVVERVEPSESGLSALAKALGAPRGGTEIGRALGVVTRRSKARDILLVTDGQSYALDVQELARLGRRITVVLVGVGALDASVGQLAAQTGGELFVVSGADAGDALTQAIASLRREHVPPRRLAALPLAIAEGSLTVAATFVGKVGGQQAG